MWQICRLFFDEKKKPLFLRSLSKNHWKNKQKLCQKKVMSSKWSFGLVESSVVNLAEKKFERRLKIFGWMSKIDVKKIFDKNFFTTNWSYRQTESSTDKGTDKFSWKWQTKVDQCPMMKKRTFSKKTSQNLLGHVVIKCDKFADCFFDKKNRYFSVQFWKNIQKTNSIFVKTMFCPQIFPLDS